MAGLTYLCTNPDCPRVDMPTSIQRDRPADCPKCGCSMTPGNNGGLQPA